MEDDGSLVPVSLALVLDDGSENVSVPVEEVVPESDVEAEVEDEVEDGGAAVLVSVVVLPGAVLDDVELVGVGVGVGVSLTLPVSLELDDEEDGGGVGGGSGPCVGDGVPVDETTPSRTTMLIREV